MRSPDDDEGRDSESDVEPPDTEDHLRRKLEALARAAGPVEASRGRRPAMGLVFAAAAIGFFLIFGAVFSRRFERDQQEEDCFERENRAQCRALCARGNDRACDAVATPVATSSKSDAAP
jgi:hypothetical protein